MFLVYMYEETLIKENFVSNIYILGDYAMLNSQVAYEVQIIFII